MAKRGRAKGPFHQELQDLLGTAAQELRNMQARSAGITFRISRSELQNHFRGRAKYWGAYADGVSDGSTDLPSPFDGIGPHIDAEFETAAKENMAQRLAQQVQYRKTIAKSAEDRARAFYFMAEHLEDQPSFVVDAGMAETFELAPGFVFGRQMIGRI